MQALKSILPVTLKRSLRRWHRRTFEVMGSDRYSHPALGGIDRKLERHLDLDRGFFIEAGANDGFAQSNTYYLERFRKWTGLLVEPVPAQAAECRKNRRARVVEAALVAEEIPGATVEIHFAGLMSVGTGVLGDTEATCSHVSAGLRAQQLVATFVVHAPARTLSGLIDEMDVSREIDLLSLDIEGAEPDALRGLDLRRHAPRFICVEARNRPEIEYQLGSRYEVAEVLTDCGLYQDLLFRRR
jgi:FkbM family methyltransferase